MNVLISVDIEEEIRSALAEYVTAYVRPLPENFTTPSVLIELMGGTSENTIDTFLVRISSRAKDNADALELLRTVLGILQNQTNEQIGELRFSTEQNLMSWGNDPVRPDLCLCSATVTVLAHKKTVNLDES
jgi:sulfite reductase beta subunit-like hemoprotein